VVPSAQGTGRRMSWWLIIGLPYHFACTRVKLVMLVITVILVIPGPAGHNGYILVVAVTSFYLLIAALAMSMTSACY